MVDVAEVLPSIIFNSATVAARLVVPSLRVPYVKLPVVEIAPLPTSIDVNPEVIEPALRAPTVVTLLRVSSEDSK